MNECFKVEYVKFDSQEEHDFNEWIKEALGAGYIQDACYHPETYVLIPRAARKVNKTMKTKIKTIEKFLFHEHCYTLDFCFEATDKFQQLDHKLISTNNRQYYIDVKGGFSIYNNHREFSINQKIMLEKYNIYVNMVEPKKMFKHTFCPEKCRYTDKTKQPRKHYYEMPTINDALQCNIIKTNNIEWL